MMKKFACIAGGIAVAASMGVHASEVTGLTTFNSGETISSSEMNGNFTTIKNAVNDNNTRIGNLESTVNDSTNGLGALGTKVTNLESTVNSLDSAVNNQSTGLGALGTKVTNLENTVNDSTNGLGALGTKVTNLENAVNDSTNGLGALGTRVGTLETRVDALESGGGCPSDMVPVGPICVDKYEASVWSNPDGTGTRYGDGTDDYASAGESSAGANDGCQDNGNNCGAIYAVSKAGVTPSTNITWFQAQQACANVGKRLLTNAEWQMAAAGTVDAGCNNTSGNVANTGDDHDGDPGTSCVSASGVFDMTGNVNEWVADWVIDDDTGSVKFGTAGTDSFITAVYRGGGPGGGNIFTYNAAQRPDFTAGVVGFRCAK